MFVGSLSSTPWFQYVHEHVVGYAVSLLDPLGRVERPMDAEVDAALTVFFLCLREGGKTPRAKRAHIPLIVFRHTVEFVRDEGEWDAVGSIVVTQHLEERPTKPSMAGGIGGNGGVKFGPVRLLACAPRGVKFASPIV